MLKLMLTIIVFIHVNNSHCIEFNNSGMLEKNIDYKNEISGSSDPSNPSEPECKDDCIETKKTMKTTVGIILFSFFCVGVIFLVIDKSGMSI